LDGPPKPTALRWVRTQKIQMRREGAKEDAKKKSNLNSSRFPSRFRAFAARFWL
jgi:hypothetical protein